MLRKKKNNGKVKKSQSEKNDEPIEIKEKKKEVKEVVKKQDKVIEKRPYDPIIYKVPDLEESILSNEINPLFTSNYPLPRFNFGFNHFIHNNKDKMAITELPGPNKKYSKVVMPFETYIGTNYNSGISAEAIKYFGISSDMPRILSRGFYKLWEMMITFDLIPLDINNFVSAHLAEGPGSFAQATIMYRDKFVKKGHTSKNDKFYAITLHDDFSEEHVPKIEKSFTDYYAKEKPVRFIQHETYPLKEQDGGKYDIESDRYDQNDPERAPKDNGDLTNPTTIEHFGGNFKEQKAMFITADGGINWKDENIQEQEASKLIFSQLCTAIGIQEKGGNFVIKFFETFTPLSIKLICILKECYTHVYLVKPLTSRESNSEKYAVCINFKESKSLYKKLLKVLKQWNERKSFVKELNDIYPSYQIDKNMISFMTAINTQIANTQVIYINKIMDYIEKNNFGGEESQTYTKNQMNASQYWINTYFRDGVSDMQKFLTMQMDNILLDVKTRIKKFLKYQSVASICF
jgi:23S rRNA U2552 (ribose-2'-O)-methylase RlmE/FtsJ